MRARVHITLKNGVLDPQGQAVAHSLSTLGFEGVGEVRVGKVVELELGDIDRADAETQVTAMCEKLLANTVIENYRIVIE